jgi:putative transposase
MLLCVVVTAFPDLIRVETQLQMRRSPRHGWAELYRKYGFSDTSLYLWRRRFGGMDVPDAKRLRELETDNAKLKKLLVEVMLDADALRMVAREILGPQVSQHAAAAMQAKTSLSERRACAVIGLSRTVLAMCRGRRMTTCNVA